MSTRAQVVAALAKLGVTDYKIGTNGRAYEVEAYAPAGSVWAASDCHGLVVSAQAPAAVVLREALADIRHGFAACTQPNCDYCTPSTD